MSSAAAEKPSPWLVAHHDQLANLHSHQACIRFVDLIGDGDYKMVVASKCCLRVYKGVALVSEHALIDHAVSVCAFFPDDARPRTPALGVAAGPNVYIYRNLRPYFKFTVPPVDIAAPELELWGKMSKDEVEYEELRESLAAMRDDGTQLSARSLDYLAIEEPDARLAYVETLREVPLKQDTVITAMETLKKSSEEPDAVSSLVIATESRQLIILDPAATTRLCQVELPGVPVFIAVSGMYDVEWRVVCACRNNCVYQVTNGEVRNQAVIRRPHIELETPPCGLCRVDKYIYVGTMDGVLHCYHQKGKKAFSVKMPAPIMDMETLSVRKNRVTNCLLVALDNGEIRIYREKSLVDVCQVFDFISTIRFGHYGREENTLVVLTKTGCMEIRMLQRMANLEQSSAAVGPPKEQDIPLQVPKKTHVWRDQMQREKEMAREMHQIFQKDLVKLRLSTARTYVKLITDGQMGLSPSGGTNIRLTATVDGLGPYFKLRLTIQNSGAKELANVPLVCTYNTSKYRLPNGSLTVPLLLPGLPVYYDFDIECVDPNTAPGMMRVLILNPGSVVPLVSSVLQMPVSELLDD